MLLPEASPSASSQSTMPPCKSKVDAAGQPGQSFLQLDACIKMTDLLCERVVVSRGASRPVAAGFPIPEGGYSSQELGQQAFRDVSASLAKLACERPATLEGIAQLTHGAVSSSPRRSVGLSVLLPAMLVSNSLLKAPRSNCETTGCDIAAEFMRAAGWSTAALEEQLAALIRERDDLKKLVDTQLRDALAQGRPLEPPPRALEMLKAESRDCAEAVAVELAELHVGAGTQAAARDARRRLQRATAAIRSMVVNEVRTCDEALSSEEESACRLAEARRAAAAMRAEAAVESQVLAELRAGEAMAAQELAEERGRADSLAEELEVCQLGGGLPLRPLDLLSSPGRSTCASSLGYAGGYGASSWERVEERGRWLAAASELGAVRRAHCEALTGCLQQSRAVAAERGRHAEAVTELGAVQQVLAAAEMQLADGEACWRHQQRSCEWQSCQ